MGVQPRRCREHSDDDTDLSCEGEGEQGGLAGKASDCSTVVRKLPPGPGESLRQSYPWKKSPISQKWVWLSTSQGSVFGWEQYRDTCGLEDITTGRLLPWTMLRITRISEFSVHAALSLQVDVHGSPCQHPGSSQWRRELEAEREVPQIDNVLRTRDQLSLHYYMGVGNSEESKNPNCKPGHPGRFTKECLR